MTTDRNSEGAELLPCPFCGEGANIGAWKQAVERHPDATAIECSNGLADCPVNPTHCDFTRDEAIAAWNRRASPSAAEVQALVERWRAIAHEYRYNPAALPATAQRLEDCADELAKLIPRGNT